MTFQRVDRRDPASTLQVRHEIEGTTSSHRQDICSADTESCLVCRVQDVDEVVRARYVISAIPGRIRGFVASPERPQLAILLPHGEIVHLRLLYAARPSLQTLFWYSLWRYTER